MRPALSLCIALGGLATVNSLTLPFEHTNAALAIRATSTKNVNTANQNLKDAEPKPASNANTNVNQKSDSKDKATEDIKDVPKLTEAKSTSLYYNFA
jgi:hypothetical protein